MGWIEDLGNAFGVNPVGGLLPWEIGKQINRDADGAAKANQRWRDQKAFIDRLNSAPVRPDAFTPRDPRTTEGYSLYSKLANLGDTGAYSAESQLAQRGARTGIEQAAQQGPMNFSGGTGARALNASNYAQNMFQGQQGAAMQGGNKLLDALRGRQASQLGALGNLTGMESNYAKNRLTRGLQGYEQDINRYAAGKAAKATSGLF
jgi:hypothetical protein